MYQRTQQWMILAANSYYLAIDLNMMLVNTILFISCAIHTSHNIGDERDARGKSSSQVFGRADNLHCPLTFPIDILNISSLLLWTPHFPLCQLARAGNFHDIFYLLDTLSIYLETASRGTKSCSLPAPCDKVTMVFMRIISVSGGCQCVIVVSITSSLPH